MADKTTIAKEAQKYLLRGQIDKAIAEWEKLIREAPDGNTYNIVGDLYLKKGDKKGAADYLHRSANFFRQDGFTLKALALYKKVLNINPQDSNALYALGQLSEEKGLATDAIKYYLATADSLSKEGEKDKLIDIYEKILGLSPGNIPLRVKVAEIFLKEGLVSDASKEYVAVAVLYEEKGEMQKAQEFYQRVLEMSPSNKDAVRGLGLLLEKSGDYAGALRYFKSLISQFPDDRALLLKYAEIALIAGKSAEAEESLQQLSRMDPEDLTVRRLLGDVYLKAGQEEKAWDEYNPVIDQMITEEKYDNAVHLLELFRRVDPAETAKALIRVFTLTRDDERLFGELVALGELYKEHGLEEEALNCFREAAQVNPYDENIQQRLREAAPEPEPELMPETEKDTISIVAGSDKTAEEIFVETDIFSRYGLLQEAIKLLEGLKSREPENIDVHLRLKTLYAETADRESAVTECLILHELYKRAGDTDNATKALKDAAEVNPADPRLEGRIETAPPDYQPGSYSESAAETAETEEGPEIEDYEDAIAEADFYIRQGLIQEASKILEKMHSLFPENKDITDRLESIGHVTEHFGTATVEPAIDSSMMLEPMSGAKEPSSELPEPKGPLAGEFEFELEQTAHAQDYGETTKEFSFPEPEVPQPEAPSEEGVPEAGAPLMGMHEEPEIPDLELPADFDISGAEVLEEAESGLPPETEISETDLTVPEETPPARPEPPAAKEEPVEEYEDLLLTDKDLVDAEEMPELALDDDVLEIFQEFKKGLEKELGDEDSETHYNLGIAYKEMGLVDDAIKEFQSSRNDPKRFIQSSTMLGICYMEKGLYSLAIDALRKVTLKITEKDESYWPVRYDLAEACEKNNNLKEALELYTAVYGWNANYRDVSEKVGQVRSQLAKGGGGEKPRDKKDRVSYL